MKHIRCWLTFLLLSLMACCPQSFASTSPTEAKKWALKAEKAAYYSGNTARSQVRMMIVDGQQRKQFRQFTLLRKNNVENADQQMMVFFSRPAEVKNTVFRVEKHAGNNTSDDRWLYLPALDLVKRIASTDKRTSFVGSHFYYEDVSGRNIREDTFEIAEDKQSEVSLLATPNLPDSVEFTSYLVTIDKATFLPVKIDYLDGKGQVYRRVEAIETKVIQGFPTVVKSKVSDLVTGGFTLMEFRNIQYELAISDDVFTERSLRTPPTRFLK